MKPENTPPQTTPIFALNTGETIMGVVEKPDSINFYIGTEPMESKEYE